LSPVEEQVEEEPEEQSSPRKQPHWARVVLEMNREPDPSRYSEVEKALWRGASTYSQMILVVGKHMHIDPVVQEVIRVLGMPEKKYRDYLSYPLGFRIGITVETDD